MKTEPGAPVRAEAEPLKMSPRPSPKNQTPKAQKNDTTNAGRTVRRKSRPAPIATWIRAKNVFHTAMWGPTKWPTLVMIQLITGLALCIVQQIGGGESLAEHEGLELQAGVKQPQETEDDL